MDTSWVFKTQKLLSATILHCYIPHLADTKYQYQKLIDYLNVLLGVFKYTSYF